MEALGSQRHLPLTVALDRAPAAVGGGPIQLDDEVAQPPKRVDPHSSDPGVDLRQREARTHAKLQETFLEDAECLSELRHVAPKGGPRRSRTRTSVPQGGLQFAEVQQAAIVGFCQRTAQLMGGQLRPKIYERSRDWSHGQPMTFDHRDPAGMVNTNLGQ